MPRGLPSTQAATCLRGKMASVHCSSLSGSLYDHGLSMKTRKHLPVMCC